MSQRELRNYLLGRNEVLEVEDERSDPSGSSIPRVLEEDPAVGGGRQRWRTAASGP